MLLSLCFFLGADLFSLYCQRDANGSIYGNLTVRGGENIYLKRYLKEKHWRVVHPEGGKLKMILSNDQYLNMNYEAILSEQCTALLNCEKTETKGNSGSSLEMCIL